MKERLNILLRTTIFWLLIFIVNRILFTLLYSNAENSITLLEFIKASFYGFRLDLSITSYFLLVVNIIIAFTFFTTRTTKIVNVLHYILIPIIGTILFSDLVIFSFWNAHLDSSAILYAKRLDVLTMSLKSGQIIMLTLLITTYITALYYWYYYVVSKTIKTSKLQKPYFIPVWLFIAGLMIIPMRGGLQHIPLNTGAAYFSKNSFSNLVAVNPAWNFMYSMKRLNKTGHKYKYMPTEKAENLFAELYAQHDTTQYVLNCQKPNIILVILESFNAAVIDTIISNSEVTPNFNSLKKEGLYFKNIYATNTRSDKGIVGILSAYPVLPHISIIKYPQKSKSLSSLPQKLIENGYSDLTFIYGGDINFANMNSYVRIIGFDNIVSKADFPSKFYNKKWGVHDEYTFDYLLENMDKSAQPSFKSYFTLSSHEPFDVPMDRVFKDDFVNSVHYTDKCLGNFVAKAKTKDWWKNTLLVFIADHGTPWKNLNNSNSKRYHVPMLWVGGALNIQDTTVDKIASQSDLTTTLLKQLHINSSEFKFGKDILNPTQKGFAFFNHNGGFTFKSRTQEQYYDLNYKDFYIFSGIETRADSLIGKAYIQTLYNDYIKR